MDKIIKKYKAFDFQSLLYYESTDRNLDSPAYDARYPVNGKTFVDYYMIDSINIENKIYNINNFNNKIKVNSTVYTVPIGFYKTIADLITGINTAIAASTVALSYNTLSQIITISAAANFTFTTEDINNAPTLFGMLGFRGNILSGSNSYVAEQAARLQYTRYVCFCSYNLSKYTQNVFGGNLVFPTMLARVITTDFVPGDNETLTRINNQNIKIKYEGSRNMGNVDIFLLDEFGNFLIPFIGNWYITLSLWSNSDEKHEFNY